jgi:hypothetical protein
MTIAPVPRAVAQYIAGFDLRAICRYRDGRLGVTRDPGGCAAAWWCEARHAGKLLRAAHDGDVAKAAAALGIEVTPHDEVLERAQAAVSRIEHGISKAQAEGLLREFNQIYRAKRLLALERGRRFMSYQQARARLRNALAKVPAKGLPRGPLLEAVFGGK